MWLTAFKEQPVLFAGCLAQVFLFFFIHEPWFLVEVYFI